MKYVPEIGVETPHRIEKTRFMKKIVLRILTNMSDQEDSLMSMTVGLQSSIKQKLRNHLLNNSQGLGNGARLMPLQ